MASIREYRQAAELALNITEVVQVNIVLTWGALTPDAVTRRAQDVEWTIFSVLHNMHAWLCVPFSTATSPLMIQLLANTQTSAIRKSYSRALYLLLNGSLVKEHPEMHSCAWSCTYLTQIGSGNIEKTWSGS